jgi:hypothetical protein
MPDSIRELTSDDERQPDLVALASKAGVPAPSSDDVVSAPDVAEPIPFIENKLYDHARLSNLLSLSIAQNHHANGGPVSRLLETMVASLTQQPEDRRGIAVSSGTAALHMACGMHALKARNVRFRWVTSAFNFFSARVGPLSGARVIDCDAHGGFDLDALRALSQDSYDGVIYANVFAQQSDWQEVAAFCAHHGKSLVVDNATGLLDRPQEALRPGSPIEIISAHYTKPSGIGDSRRSCTSTRCIIGITPNRNSAQTSSFCFFETPFQTIGKGSGGQMSKDFYTITLNRLLEEDFEQLFSWSRLVRVSRDFRQLDERAQTSARFVDVVGYIGLFQQPVKSFSGFSGLGV